MKQREITQAELAEKIGITESTISRFISEKTDKLSDENIIRIADVFSVSTDFLLGVTDIPDRKNYDISELGLSSLAARNLYTGAVDTDAVNRLLEHPRFAKVTHLITQYFDETMSAGIAAQNQLLDCISDMLLDQGKIDPKEKRATKESANAIKRMKTPVHQNDLNTIQTEFMATVRDIKKDKESKIETTKLETKESFDKMRTALKKGQDKLDLRTITPEDIVDAMVSTMSNIDVITPDMLEQLRAALIPLFRILKGNGRAN